MEKHTLKSMTDFVLEQGMNPLQNDVDAYIKTHNYAIFLKQPLKLGMFIPCDENDKPIQKPLIEDYRNDDGGNMELFKNNLNIFNKAKEKVLLKGFSLEFNALVDPEGDYLDTSRFEHRDIESLVGADLELTESAVKQIYN